jgi:DNA-binding MarR family transcriptional regulator
MISVWYDLLMEPMSSTDLRAAPSPEGPPGGSVVFLLSSLGFAASRAFQRALAAVDLEPRQFGVLNAVALSGGTSQQALAGAIGVPPSRLVAIVDELEDRKLVERRRNPDDRRAYALVLTPKGRKVLDKARGISRDNEEAFCAPLRPPEREQLLGFLRRLAAGRSLPVGVHPGLTEPD